MSKLLIITKKIIPLLLLFVIVFGAFTPTITTEAFFHEETLESINDTKESLECMVDPTCMLAQGSIGMLKFFGGVSTYIGGTLLDYSINQTIVKSGTYFNNPGITTAWGILRDLANIFFIFILLFIGIVTILQTTKFEYRQLLRNLIIMALLVNFSFFFTQVVIDVSNVMATEVYKEIGGKSLSTVFMDQMNLSSLFDPDTFLGETRNNGDLGDEVLRKIAIIGIFGSILFLIITFIFVATAILLISRVVVLSFILAVSPVAFAAWVLPGTTQYFALWGKKLIANAFFAPIYLLGVLLSLKMMEGIGSTSEGTTFVEALLSGDGDSIGAIFDFAIVAGFMIASLIIAKQLGAYGAAAVANRGGKLAKSIGTGITGGVGRFAVGGLSNLALKGTRAIEKRAPVTGRVLSTPFRSGVAAGFGSGKGYEQQQADIAKRRGEIGKGMDTEEKRKYAKKLEGKKVAKFIPTRGAGSREAAEKLKKDVAADDAHNAKTDELGGTHDTSLKDEGAAIDSALQDTDFAVQVEAEIDAQGNTAGLAKIDQDLKRLIDLGTKEGKLDRTDQREKRHLTDEKHNIESSAIKTVSDREIDKIDKETAPEGMSAEKTTEWKNEREGRKLHMRRNASKVSNAGKNRKESGSKYKNHSDQGVPSGKQSQKDVIKEAVREVSEENASQQPTQQPPTQK